MTGEVPIPGAMNFRDIGGLPAREGTTRYGRLYRSGTLSELTDEGRVAMAGLRLGRILDLRSADELERAPSLIHGVGAPMQNIPVLPGSASSLFAEDLTLSDLYDRIVTDYAPSVVAVMRAIIADAPVLVHCTAGKDRTGVTVAIALAAVGTDREAVIENYALTEELTPPARIESIVRAINAHHPGTQHLADLATRSPAPVMRELLAGIDAEYGSAADYLRAQGMARAELTALHEVLIQRN